MERDCVSDAVKLSVLAHGGPEVLRQERRGFLVAEFEQFVHRQNFVFDRQIRREVSGHDHQRRWLAGFRCRFGFHFGGVITAGKYPAHFHIIL
ncbi:hypothetical protein SRABI106_02985 [Rahnella aquatilis]|nr:hypothetical protein SRABI106_02985 [Rahnella aquatilis]